MSPKGGGRRGGAPKGGGGRSPKSSPKSGAPKGGGARAGSAKRGPSPSGGRGSTPMGGGPRRPTGGPRRAPGPSAEGAARRSPRRGLGGDQVEGRQAVRELLLLGRRRVIEVCLASDLDPAPILDEIRDLAADERVTVREISRTKLDAMARTEAPQGVVARAAPLEEHDVDDLASGRIRATAAGDGPPFLLLLDGLTDPGNLGALLRTASAAGVTGVVLPKHRSAHVTPTVAKAAAGAIEHLPMALVGGIPAALTRLQSAGVWVMGLDADGDRSLWEVQPPDVPVALVVGAEGSGLSRLVRQRCDAVVSIPMRGPLESLNAATAGALACYEIARARRS